MAKIAKTADRKKVMDTTKSTACPKCGKETRIVKRVKVIDHILKRIGERQINSGQCPHEYQQALAAIILQTNSASVQARQRNRRERVADPWGVGYRRCHRFRKPPLR